MVSHVHLKTRKNSQMNSKQQLQIEHIIGQLHHTVIRSFTQITECSQSQLDKVLIL